MSLVDDDVLERELLECALFDETDFVGRDADFEVLGDEAARHNLRTFLLGPSEDDGLEVGCPLLKLALPVAQSGLRDDDEVRTLDTMVVLEVGEERNGLQCLAETLEQS